MGLKSWKPGAGPSTISNPMQRVSNVASCERTRDFQSVGVFITLTNLFNFVHQLENDEPRINRLISEVLKVPSN